MTELTFHLQISNPELGVRDRASLIQERTGEFSRHGSDRSSLKTATFDDTTEVPVSSSSSHKNTAAECDQTVMVIDQDPGVTRPDIPVPLLPRIRALFVGGTCSGKTSLIRFVTTKHFLTGFVPTFHSRFTTTY